MSRAHWHRWTNLAVLSVAPLVAQVTSWRHLSTIRGELPLPGPGRQQTCSAVFDIDGDGINDFVITERTMAPSVVWYQRHAKGWSRYILEPLALRIEAGCTSFDVDTDGDLDFVAGGDAKSNEVWWWENPRPAQPPAATWRRYPIKNWGAPKHHDMIFGDFDGDGRAELAFWNQGAGALYLCDIPAHPRTSTPWPCSIIYSYSDDSEPLQRGKPERFKSVNEHEGLAAADIDHDGKLDIVGGGRWFRHVEGRRFQENLIDPSYAFTRVAVGDLKAGGRPEVVLVVGDGVGPLIWYEWVRGTWLPHELVEVDSGHSLALADFDGDGALDIFCAEMRLDGRNPQSKVYVFFGDGKGNFRKTVVATGYDLHESRVADLDGNGTLDILGKPYNWETPRLDIWLSFRTAQARR